LCNNDWKVSAVSQMQVQMTDRVVAPQLMRRNHWNSHLERHGFAQPEQPAFRFQGVTTSWRQLHDRVRALAEAMARRGVAFGHRVAVLMTNRPEFMETILAANRLGAVAVPVNFRLTVPEVAYLLKNSGACLLFADDGTVHRHLDPGRSVLGPHDGDDPTRRWRSLIGG